MGPFECRSSPRGSEPPILRPFGDVGTGTPPADPEDESTMPRRRRLVLIVDDSPEDREVVRRYLQKDREVEYQFIEKASGNEGLAICRSSEIDCLLLDYDLPDLD